jgi:SAM-dependent methyltransferase
MKEMDSNLNAEIIRWQENLFKRSMRRGGKLKKIEELVGNAAGQQCLEISSGDGTISTHLRSLGGRWKTLAIHPEAATSLGYSLPETILPLEEEKLPFDDQSLDRVVVVDALKYTEPNGNFIRECHRVLKSDGWVIICEEYRRPISCTALLQRIFGVTPVAQGAKRNGYTAKELYHILNEGFDVPETICYSNAALESTATWGEFVQKTLCGGPYWRIPQNAGQNVVHAYRKLNTLMGLTYPWLWLLGKLEFFPGHKLAIKSRRRLWRPRHKPQLVDGRSIAEATINTKIGTAAPF